jgi:hypothetical protein
MLYYAVGHVRGIMPDINLRFRFVNLFDLSQIPMCLRAGLRCRRLYFDDANP